MAFLIFFHFLSKNDSIKQAVRDNSIASDGNIISCCRRKVNKKNGEYVVVKGFTYRYFDDPL